MFSVIWKGRHEGLMVETYITPYGNYFRSLFSTLLGHFYEHSVTSTVISVSQEKYS